MFSRLKKGRGPLASWLGFQPNSFDPDTVTVRGPNTFSGSDAVRNYTYRLFDRTRVPMKARAPGAGPATVAANPLGQNTVSIARFHQKIPLNYEFLGNLSKMVGPNSQIDNGGQDYIRRQTNFLGEQCNNTVEGMAAGMLRDSLYFIMVGDDWFVSFTGPTGAQVGFQVPFLIPAGNKAQLNMLGSGNLITLSWANVAASIIGMIQQIIAAYAQLSRDTLTDVWINSTMWINIITNTEVRNLAGSSNTPFAEFERLDESGMDNTGVSNKYAAILRGQPTLKWHFCDDTLGLMGDIDPVYTGGNAVLNKLIPDNMAIFATEPSPDWTRMYLGGEYVVENPGMAGALRMGWYFWHEYVTQPSAIELICVLNAIPILPRPLVIAPATVVF